MRKAYQTQVVWPICAGILLACVGMALIGFGEWNSLDLSQGWLVYLLGLTFFFAGLFLVWIDPLATPALQDESVSESDGIYLGRFELNGRSIRAYERESDLGGRQLRLKSYPAITPEQEAAFIRYIVNEGLAENIWRGMSRKIEEEASWAFFQ